MDIKFKGSIILIVLIAALYYTFPTYRAYQPGVDPQTVENKVNLGLDLQGGMYLDIEIKAEEAVKEIIRRTAVELEDLMIDEQVDFVEVRQTGGSIIVEMEAGKKVNLELAPYDRYLVQFDQLPEGELIYLNLKVDEANRIRESAVSQALEVLRNRIDSLGITIRNSDKHTSSSWDHGRIRRSLQYLGDSSLQACSKIGNRCVQEEANSTSVGWEE